MMKNAIALVISVICFTSCASFSEETDSPPLGFKNEPDGFRDITWGSWEPDLKNSSLKRQGQQIYQPNYWSNKLKFVKTEVYTRKDDKLEFGEVSMKSLEYHYYEDQFAFAVFSFDDFLTHQQKSMQKIQDTLPLSKLYRKSRVNAALEKYFGAPTEKPFFLAKMNSNALKNDGIFYRGKKTNITAICDDSGSSCWLVFSSAKFENDLRSEKQDDDQKLAEKKKRAEQRRAEIRAKPDF